jgi:hypothetical protein
MNLALERSKPMENIGRATLNPAAEFKRPMNVVAATNLVKAEKLAILRAWEADERALQRAEDEGMGGGEHAHLHRVYEALSFLKEEALHCNSSPRLG